MQKNFTNLLKDLKAQSDLYSSKVRSLLGNLTRDVLAGILLIGFTMFTKFTEIEKLSRYENIINIIFCGLAIYFTASAITQAIIDTSDLILSRVELNHWCKCTSEVIPKKELKKSYQKDFKSTNYSYYNYIYIINDIIRINNFCNMEFSEYME